MDLNSSSNPNHLFIYFFNDSCIIVTTLTLGLQPRQGLVKVWAKCEGRGVTFHAHGSVGECEGMNPHTPK